MKIHKESSLKTEKETRLSRHRQGTGSTFLQLSRSDFQVNTSQTTVVTQTPILTMSHVAHEVNFVLRARQGERQAGLASWLDIGAAGPGAAGLAERRLGGPSIFRLMIPAASPLRCAWPPLLQPLVSPTRLVLARPRHLAPRLDQSG